MQSSPLLARPRAATACWLGLLAVLAWPSASPGGDSPAGPAREPFVGHARSSAAPGDGSTGWWAGGVGVVAALAGFGGLGLVSKRLGLVPGGHAAAPGGLKVIGRTSLSPRHSVYLLQAGDRVLIVGTGSQGAPSLLGELDPAVKPRTASPSIDLRVGGDA